MKKLRALGGVVQTTEVEQAEQYLKLNRCLSMKKTTKRATVWHDIQRKKNPLRGVKLEDRSLAEDKIA